MILPILRKTIYAFPIKTYKVIWKHGHFIEKETGQRIIPIQNAEYILIGQEPNFQRQDEPSAGLTPRNVKAQEEELAQKYLGTQFFKMLSRETPVYFRLGNSKTVKGDLSREYLFQVALLEDLYLYLLKGKDPKPHLSWRLATCICQ